VGAGISAYGEPAQRLPLWHELLDRLTSEGIRLGLIPDGGDRVIMAALEGHRYSSDYRGFRHFWR
jgi:hypothetical protein